MDQDGLDGRDNHSDHHRNNPIQIINESVDQVVGIVGKLPALAADMDYGSPDVLKRGVLTADEVSRTVLRKCRALKVLTPFLRSSVSGAV